MKKRFVISLATLLGSTHPPLFGALHDKMPVLESDLNYAQASHIIQTVSVLREQIPDKLKLHTFYMIRDEVYPLKQRAYERLFNVLSAAIFKDEIDKNNLRKTLHHLTLEDERGEPFQRYGHIDDEFRGVARNLLAPDIQDDLNHHDPNIIFLKTRFLDNGRNYVKGYFAGCIHRVNEQAQELQDRFARISPEEEDVAEHLIVVCRGLIEKLQPLLLLEDDHAFKNSFDDLKNKIPYQNLKREYDELRDALISGEHITLAEVIDDA
jgi:hypothetical protein